MPEDEKEEDMKAPPFLLERVEVKSGSGVEVLKYRTFHYSSESKSMKDSKMTFQNQLGEFMSVKGTAWWSTKNQKFKY